MRKMYCLISLLSMLMMSSTICAAAGNEAQHSSTINLRVETSTADLGNILNKSINKDLYKGQGSFGASVEIVRTGPVVVTSSNDYIYLSLPVQLTFGYGMFSTGPLKSNLRFKAKVNVTPDGV